MVQFNPSIGNLPSPDMPDQTGASRGATPDRSFEYLFKGVGDLIQGGYQTYDTAVKASISSDIRNGYDQENKLYTDTAGKSSTGWAPWNAPSGVRTGAQSMQALQTAYDQGKVSDVYYYGQLTALLKDMRSKYPGYEGYIDDAMQNITGVRPANAYREAIIQDYNKSLELSRNETNKWDTYVKQNEQYIGQLFPDYFDNPDKYSQADIRKSVSALKAENAQIDQENSRVAFLKSMNELTDQRAEETATKNLNLFVTSYLSGTGNAIGLNGNNLLQKIGDMSKSGFTEQDYNDIVNQLNVGEASLRTNLLQMMNKPLDDQGNSYASILGQKKVNDLVDNSMAQFAAIKQMVVDKDLGMAGYYTRLNSLIGERTLNTLLSTSPDAVGAMALKNIDPALADVFLSDPKRQTTLFDQVIPEVTARIVSGQADFGTVTNTIVNSDESNKDKTGGINSLIDQSTTAIKSGLLTPDQMSSTIKSVYSLDSKGKDIFSYVHPDEYQSLYYRLFNPQITAQIATNGSPEDLQTYYKAAYERFFAIPEFRKAAGAFKDNAQFFDYFQVNFDPNQGRLVLVNKKSGEEMQWGRPLPIIFGGPIGNLIDNTQIDMQRRTATNAVNTLNNAFANFEPMLTAMGVQPQDNAQFFKTVLTQLNVDLEAGKQDGFFDWLNKQVSNAAGTVAGGLDFSITPEDKKKLQDLGSPSQSGNYQINEFDFPQGSFMEDYYTRLKKAESGGNANAANPNSSALGPYQFLKSTWDDLIRRFPNAGLTPDGRTDEAQNEIAIRLFTGLNSQKLSDAGLNPSNANLYAAHFLGAEGAPDVLNGNDTDLVSDHVSPKVIRDNPFLRGMTVLEFKRWLKTKVG